MFALLFDYSYTMLLPLIMHSYITNNRLLLIASPLSLLTLEMKLNILDMVGEQCPDALSNQ